MGGTPEKIAGGNSAIGQEIRCEVAAEVLRASGELRLRVFGGSMLPSIWPGDVLLIRRAAPADMEPGGLVLYARNGGFVVHRIVRKNGDMLTTRGDALREDDEPVPFSQALGKVAMIERSGAQFAPREKLKRPDRLLSLLMAYFAPLKAFALHLNSLRLKFDRAQSNRETAPT
jgi:signal peptidase I